MAVVLMAVPVSAQVDRHDVRSGNRRFSKEKYREAEIDYRKALLKDTVSLAANYNLASTLYREENYEEAAASMDRIKEIAPLSPDASDYHYNAGDIALAKKDYASAVESFRQSLLLNPGDLDAKENYIYAKKMLENQQNNDGEAEGTTIRIRIRIKTRTGIRIRTMTGMTIRISRSGNLRLKSRNCPPSRRSRC